MGICSQTDILITERDIKYSSFHFQVQHNSQDIPFKEAMVRITNELYFPVTHLYFFPFFFFSLLFGFEISIQMDLKIILTSLIHQNKSLMHQLILAQFRYHSGIVIVMPSLLGVSKHMHIFTFSSYWQSSLPHHRKAPSQSFP